METGKKMLDRGARSLFSLLLFLAAAPAFAQEQTGDLPGEEDLGKKYFTGLDYAGISLALGSNSVKLADFNTRLQSLQIPQLENTLVAGTVSISLTNKMKDEFSLDFMLAGTSKQTESTQVLLSTSTLGVTLYKSLLPLKRRIGLHVMGGLRDTDMKFEYNNARNVANSFNTLFSNQSQDARQITLQSQNNIGFTLGGRLMLPLTRKESIRPLKFSLALESGYSYYLVNEPWKEAGAFKPVADMPELKPDNFFVNLTLSGKVKI